MIIKNCNLDIKMVDNSDRIVKGYFSSFGNVDSDGDIIAKGAFAKSIMEHGVGTSANRKIAHLLYHNVNRPIGNLITLKEDEVGLYFESKIGTHTDGEDALRMYKELIIKEHSIGFNIIQDKTSIDDNGVRTIKEVQLWEGSAVVFGANSLTPNLTQAKSQEDINKIEDQIDERFEVFVKALRDGNYQEKYNHLWEVELRQLKELSKSLKRFEPSIETPIIESDNDSNISELIKNNLKF